MSKIQLNYSVPIEIIETPITHEFKQKMLVELLRSYSNKRSQMIKLENMMDYLNKLS